CCASSPIESPSSPRVVARLAAACKIVLRLSTPSTRGLRPPRGWPPDWRVPEFLLFMVDILARSVVLFKARSVVLLLERFPETLRSRSVELRDTSSSTRRFRLHCGQGPPARHLGER